MRIILAAKATIIWSVDAWEHTNSLDATLEEEMNLWFADFPTQDYPAGSVFAFTCFWNRDQRWQGHNWQVSIL